MSNHQEIAALHHKLENEWLARFEDLEGRLGLASRTPSTDITSLFNDYQHFKEDVLNMFTLLKNQISALSKQVDNVEMWNRRKALLLNGIQEQENEDTKQVVVTLIKSKLDVDVPADSLKVCHRLGFHKSDTNRPILLRFKSTDCRSAVWRNKTKLKGTSITLSEFLTQSRRSVFIAARSHFGMRQCWTADGVVVVKLTTGKLARLTTNEELESIVKLFPKLTSDAPPGYSGSISKGRTNLEGLSEQSNKPATTKNSRSKRQVKGVKNK